MSINHEIIVKCLQRTASVDEQLQLEQWLIEKTSHQAYFEKIKSIWGSADCNVDNENIDMNAAWSCISSKISSTETKRILPVKIENWLRIAASIVLVIGVGLGLFYFQEHPSQESVAMIEVTSSGALEEFRLPDGSKVTLMPNSTISYANDFISFRKIALRGGAYFDVQKSRGKQFEVVVEQLGITVLGTKFMVRQSNLRTEVYVEEGKVEVGIVNNINNSIISSGEGVYLDYSSEIILPITAVKDNILSWRTGVLEFNNARLTEVLETLSKHYNITVKLKNSEIGKCHLTSRFDNKSIDEVLQVLEIVLNVEINSTSSNEYLITGKGC